MLLTVSIVVKGKVQGVYYRQSTNKKAIELNISGKVKNMPDGSVLIIATGNHEQLYQLTEWCRTGPASATVTEVLISELPLSIFSDFIIER